MDDTSDVQVLKRPPPGDRWRSAWERLEDMRSDEYMALAEIETLEFHRKQFYRPERNTFIINPI